MRLRDDDRGLAIGIVLFFAAITIAALLYIMLDPAFSSLQSTALNQTSNANATQTINERTTVWNNILFIPLFIAGIGIIARAVFESRRP